MTQSSVLNPQSSSWLVRLLLAALLAFCSEIVLWTNPPSRSLIDWMLLALGYAALSALLLEIAARYRLRDAFGALTLAGVYGMLNGLLLNPHSALIDVPRTLLTRAMGAHAFAGLLALALFLALAGGGLRTRRAQSVALLLALVAGLGWGTWARWSPPVFSNQPETAPAALVIFGAVGVSLIFAALFAVAKAVRRVSAPVDLRLGARGWAFTLIVLGGLLVIHLLQNEIDSLSLSIIVTLTVFSVMIIWFQKRNKGATLLDGVPSGAPVIVPALLVVGFALAGVVGYSLPRGNIASDPLALISALFTAYGLIWLPAVSIVLGARAFSRQARAMNL
ncbi:MAG: hypothetical protein LC121_00940 [Anaerolineae bacterium]|nr:hypothetical protein [Anaerolineae bacterium]